ncbi:hypothetical protein Tco_1245818 [Tanacetum coccineum]
MTEAKGDGGEGLYVRGRSDQRDMKQGRGSARSKSRGRGSKLRCYIRNPKEHLKRDCPKFNQNKSQELLDEIMDSGGSYHMTYKRDYLFDFEEWRKLISLGTIEKEGFTMKMQPGKIKVIRGSLVVLSGTRRANYVYTLDGQAMKRKTLKGRKQLGEFRRISEWMEDQDGFSIHLVVYNEKLAIPEQTATGKGTSNSLMAAGSDDEIPPPSPSPQTQTPTQQAPHTVSTIKLPILKKGEYDIWAMKIEHYLAHTDYPIWEVIQRGNGPVSISTDTNGVIKVLPPKTAEEILARERERKSRTTLLMALPEDHLAKFHKMTDAKEMWEAIKSRFGGNDE